jgi:hypothetical protein
LDYDVAAEDVFGILIHTETGPFIHVKVDKSKYEVRADMSKESALESAQLYANVNYTDADTFTASVQMITRNCDAADVRAPQTIVLDVVSKKGAKQGKAMLYMPRWLFKNDEVTCDTAPTDATKMTLYTDYVCDDMATTASIHMIPVTVSDVGNFGNYEAADFCANFPDYCVAGKSFGDPNVIATTYTNPFCITSDKATWGGACSSAETAISTPEYSDASHWILPTSIPSLAVILPSTL